jgi:transcriptional regulator with XRE-family HTH domain
MGRKEQEAKTFAERLRQLVEASGLTQGAIARRAGVSPQAVSRLLTAGNADVTLSIACRLAWALGKSVSAFEEAVFEELKMKSLTRELIDRELTRGRLRQKLNAAQARVAEGEALLLAPGDGSAPGQAARRWLEGMIRHWRQQAEKLEERLRELGQT